MKLSPLDIRKQDFNRTLRGFDADEVGAFLDMLSEQWQELLDERRRQDETVRDLRSKIEHYERVEEALQEALQTTRRNAEKTLESAEREAKAIRKEAEAEAKEIKADAKEQRDRLKQEAKQVGERRGEIVAQLRAFLLSEMELLARFEGEDPLGFIKLLPAEAQRQLRQLSGDETPLERETSRKGESPAAQKTPTKQEAPAKRQGASGADAGPPAPASPRADAPEPETPRSETPSGAAASSARDAAGAGPSASVQGEGELPDFLDRFSGFEEAPLDEEDQPASEQDSVDELEGGAPASKTDLQGAPDEAPSDESESDWNLNSLFSAGDESSADDESSAGKASQEEALADEDAEAGAEKRASDSGSLSDAVENPAASTEEIEKIRRILNDMD